METGKWDNWHAQYTQKHYYTTFVTEVAVDPYYITLHECISFLSMFSLLKWDTFWLLTMFVRHLCHEFYGFNKEFFLYGLFWLGVCTLLQF